MARVVKGQVAALFAFDVGHGASLERLSAMLGAEEWRVARKSGAGQPRSLQPRPRASREI